MYGVTDTTSMAGHPDSLPLSGDSFCAGQYMGRSASPVDGVRHSEDSDNSEAKTSIKDRIAYPFRAIKNRLLGFCGLGAGVGAAVGFSIPVLVGAVTGFCIGGVVKLAKMFAGRESDAHINGAFIGAAAGFVIGLPFAAAGAVVGAVGGIIAGTAGNLAMLPVDIYRAATLPEDQLNPWKLQAQQLKEQLTAAVKETLEKYEKE